MSNLVDMKDTEVIKETVESKNFPVIPQTNLTEPSVCIASYDMKVKIMKHFGNFEVIQNDHNLKNSNSPVFQYQCFSCGESVKCFLTDVLNSRQQLRPILNNPNQSIYVQFGKTGLASFHFNTDPEKCYINYENAPTKWKLCDGKRPPQKKYFKYPEYNNESRIFEGIIYWGDHPFIKGENTWKHQIQFSKNFSAIESGHVYTYDIAKIDEIKSASGIKSERIYSQLFGLHTSKDTLVYKLDKKYEESRMLEFIIKELNICYLCRCPIQNSVILGCNHLGCMKCVLNIVKTDGVCTFCETEIILSDCRIEETNGLIYPFISLKNPAEQIYVQNNREGLASYHFHEGKTQNFAGSFIFYKNTPQNWLLDNGQKPPEKVYFEETSYDKE